MWNYVMVAGGGVLALVAVTCTLVLVMSMGGGQPRFLVFPLLALVLGIWLMAKGCTAAIRRGRSQTVRGPS